MGLGTAFAQRKRLEWFESTPHPTPATKEGTPRLSDPYPHVGFSLAHLFIKLPLYRFPDVIVKIVLKVMNRSFKFVVNIHLYI